LEKDEIDLKELFSQIWSRKWKIAIFSFLVTTLVTTILIMTPNSYRSYITLLPQGEQSSSGDFEALAGLAGIRVGAATVSPYNTMSSILKDDSLHEYIVQKYALLERVENQENLVFPFELQFENSKDIDISEAERLFDIYKYLSETVSLSEDTKSGIITLSVEIIEKFVYSLWDAGLKLGHRVHEISELEEVAKSDITIKTALIEGRKVIGSSFIWGTVEQKLNYIRDTNQEDFFKEKLLERDGRYKRYPFDSMTPNLKEGVGGFRDANLLFWILNVKFKTTSIREFSGELFSEEEFRKFSIALDLLFSVRTYLHFSLKKKRDKVVLEDVPYLSELFSQNQFQTLQKILSAMKVVHLFTARVIEKSIRD
jgi:hypothetical protein